VDVAWFSGMRGQKIPEPLYPAACDDRKNI
jgi:hypothetical protein